MSQSSEKNSPGPVAKGVAPTNDPFPGRADRIAALRAALDERILVLDGAAGTYIQQFDLDEDGVRSDRFAGW